MSASIEFVQIYGERNSGTNYLDGILRRNVQFDPDRVLGSTDKANRFDRIFGFKHWFLDDELLKNPLSDRTLFLAIFRDPLFWLRSMSQLPYQGVRHSGVPLAQFLRQEWYAEEDGKEMMIERDPATGERFGNILKLRSAKIENFLSLERKVPNFTWVRYEDIMFDSGKFLRILSHEYPGLLKGNPKTKARKKERIKLWLKKGRQKREILQLFDKHELAFVRDQVDLQLEERIGYRI